MAWIRPVVLWEKGEAHCKNMRIICLWHSDSKLIRTLLEEGPMGALVGLDLEAQHRKPEREFLQPVCQREISIFVSMPRSGRCCLCQM